MIRKLYWPTVLGLVASGAAALLAIRATWAHTKVSAPSMPEVEVSVTGSQIVPGAAALALVILATALGVLAAGPIVRRLLAVMVSASATVGFYLSVLTEGNEAMEKALAAVAASGVEVTWYGSNARLVAAAAFVVAGCLGIVVLLFAHRWPTMGSRYESPAAKTVDPADLWRAMDDGIDPTQ